VRWIVRNFDGSDMQISCPEVSRQRSRGSIISIFATGLGPTNPVIADGEVAAEPLAAPVMPIVGGINHAGAEILYAGAAPGQIAGVFQINIRAFPRMHRLALCPGCVRSLVVTNPGSDHRHAASLRS
jgi:uncharacterized protein (TIGR03437 family)